MKPETYIVYSKNGCPACDKAIALLKARGKNVLIKKFDEDPTNCKKDMGKLYPAAKIIPQIFVVTEHFDGFEQVEEYFKLQDKLNGVGLDRDYESDDDSPWSV